MSVRAAIMIIADEVLSGRTQDINVRTLARFVGSHGVELSEVRIIRDDIQAIVATVNELRRTYDYVFSTGGLGPTHDDKTADAMAEAFGVSIDVREDARAILVAHYKDRSSLNEARLRMARIPDTASLIANPVSRAPGFQIGNVFVLAGVPSIVQGMLQDVGHRIRGGAVVRSRTIRAMGVPEGNIASGLGQLEQAAEGKCSFGSYPWFTPEGFGVHLVVRSSDPDVLEKAALDLMALVRSQGGEPEEVTEAS